MPLANASTFYSIPRWIPIRTCAARPYQTVALAGVIYTVKPGIDIDLGYREGLNVAAPTRQLLFGFTCRGVL